MEHAETFEDRRRAEMEAGRSRVVERMQSSQVDDPNFNDRVKAAERQLKEDDKRREELFNAEGLNGQAVHDRAGAEVIDQAQTELEAMGHAADRVEKIITWPQQLEMERQEGNADPDLATTITTHHVTAQAVNQPTVLANEAGIETEGRPLNTTLGPSGASFSDEALALDRQEAPSDKVVPKTRKAAEKVAKGKVPHARKLVKEQAVVTQYDPDKNEAIDAVRRAPAEAMNAGQYNTNQALKDILGSGDDDEDDDKD
jgi:hypothetical protein